MTTRRKTPWANGPEEDNRIILDVARQHIESVPYKVSVRWVFYRLYGEGHYKDKDEYDKFDDLCSKARRSNWQDFWHPGTLVDDTRGVLRILYGYPDSKMAIKNIPNDIDLTVDHFFKQKYYVELWYEARAMSSQFRYYTTGIDLVPMGGMSSISYNWKLAKRLEEAYERYKRPIIILYFGDEDLAGHRIKTHVEEDVRTWCYYPFKIHWCGLTEAQALKYGVPHSVKKKGYQWEGLADEDAARIITTNVDMFIDRSIVERAEKKRKREEARWSKVLRKAIEEEEK